MYMIEYAFTDGIGGSCRNSEGGSDSTASRSINMASTEQMAIEMFVIDHFADHGLARSDREHHGQQRSKPGHSVARSPGDENRWLAIVT